MALLSNIADITVFSLPNCAACFATKQVLKNHGMTFNDIDVSKNIEEAGYLVENGFRTMPVIRVIYIDGSTDMWSGFKPDAIYNVKHGLKP